jgi:hypothetical protein
MREIRKRSPDGHQSSILSTNAVWPLATEPLQPIKPGKQIPAKYHQNDLLPGGNGFCQPPIQSSQTLR